MTYSLKDKFINMQRLTSTLKNYVIPYFSTFRKLFAIHLNDEVAMMVSIYPYPNGIVAVVYLNKEGKWQNEVRSTSSSMIEALNRTNLFDFRGQSPEFQTPSIAVTPNKIVFVKSLDKSEWSDTSLNSDISDIISKVKTIQSSKANAS